MQVKSYGYLSSDCAILKIVGIILSKLAVLNTAEAKFDMINV